jgi:hypothetical protein
MPVNAERVLSASGLRICGPGRMFMDDATKLESFKLSLLCMDRFA